MKALTGNGQDDAPRKRKTQWKQDPDAVKADILRVATEEFATNGLSGARIDEIARRTQASKRMIYYYFGDKQGLYRSVLESVYGTLRGNEARLMVDDLEPVDALRKLVELTFDAHVKAPDFVRLVMIENIHHADYLKQSKSVPALNKAIIDKLEDVCAKGKALGLFYEDVDPLELHWFISSFSFYNVSNRATFSTSFGKKLFTAKGQAQLKRRAVDLILGSVVKRYVREAHD